MRVSVFGLGYVGAVTAACLAREGHQVIGVDINLAKVELINRGRSPVLEKGVELLIGEAVRTGRLSATSDAPFAVQGSEVSLVCVGTPGKEDGSLDLRYVKRVCQDIGEVLRGKESYHLVVFRSTMLPGSVEGVLMPVLESYSGKAAWSDFGVAVNPEFMREGSSVHDFYHPARTVIGERDRRDGDALEELYRTIDAPVVRTDIKTAELVKYVDNAFHALKIAFANEIGRLCKSEGIDSHRVMDIFLMDTKLNLSAAYLRPGFAFGGSCLPKDLKALSARGRERRLGLPILEAVLTSNEEHKKAALELVLGTGKAKVGILGLSFKAGTDDLRESPAIELIKVLVERGKEVYVYDGDVSVSSIMGANRAYIEVELPYLASLMCSTMEEVLERAEILVLTKWAKEFGRISERLREGQVIIDLARAMEPSGQPAQYEGMCW